MLPGCANRGTHVQDRDHGLAGEPPHTVQLIEQREDARDCDLVLPLKEASTTGDGGFEGHELPEIATRPVYWATVAPFAPSVGQGSYRLRRIFSADASSGAIPTAHRPRRPRGAG